MVIFPAGYSYVQLLECPARNSVAAFTRGWRRNCVPGDFDLPARLPLYQNVPARYMIITCLSSSPSRACSPTPHPQQLSQLSQRNYPFSSRVASCDLLLQDTEFVCLKVAMSLSTLRTELIQIPLSLLVLIGSAIALAFHYAVFYDSRRNHLPPSPKGWPIVGNTFQLDLQRDRNLQLMAWAKKFGHIYHLRLGSSDFIFLNSPRIVKDLLDKRGNIYLDRPRLPMAGEAYTKGLNVWNVIIGVTVWEEYGVPVFMSL